MNKTIVIYYSCTQGNTRKIAELVKRALDADIFPIDTVMEYSGSYDDILFLGKQQVKNHALPELRQDIDISPYNIIALGAPVWWYTLASAMQSFITGKAWSGKAVIPFVTSGGWPGKAIRTMKALCKGASFYCEKEINFDAVNKTKMTTLDGELYDWIKCVADVKDIISDD